MFRPAATQSIDRTKRFEITTLGTPPLPAMLVDAACRANSANIHAARAVTTAGRITSCVAISAICRLHPLEEGILATANMGARPHR